MTRKRFIKLMMSKGYNRNGAVNIAKNVPASGMTYEKMYLASIGFKNMYDAIISAIPTAIETLASGIGEMATILTDCIHNMTQAISDAFAVLEEGEDE